MKITLKSTIGVLRYNGKEYGAGDKVEMPKEEAVRIAHHIEEAEEIFGEKKARLKTEADDKKADDKKDNDDASKQA